MRSAALWGRLGNLMVSMEARLKATSLGRIKEIADYCERDVVNTYRVWVRYELFRGNVAKMEFDASETDLTAFISARAGSKPHLQHFIRGKVRHSIARGHVRKRRRIETAGFHPTCPAARFVKPKWLVINWSSVGDFINWSASTINLVIFAESMLPLGHRLEDAGVNAHPLAGLLIGGHTVSRRPAAALQRHDCQPDCDKNATTEEIKTRIPYIAATR
jgi:hypothetical protein